ncbi:MAG: CoB--CoM heterodisulfide reductase iron-sulfur subunit B family protein [Chloroflexota bacterium]|nr:CoB--CoM heterodisulfide reductase iron-sulfur subunit B family protein [Chloroflexota bacterium]
MTTQYMYYPGCSMDGTGRAYHDSIEAVLPALDIGLAELDDWNCCGATEYLGISPLRSQALVGRNLAIAEKQKNGTDTLVAPCSACYVNLARTDAYVRESKELAATVNEALAADDMSYTPGSVKVRHLLEIMIDDVGLEELGEHVTRPLTGLKLAPYMGCLVSRPDFDDRWEHREHPRALDQLLLALGADVVDFPRRTDCCGGHMTQISPETGLELIRRLIVAAELSGAHALVTVCPMCQMNVDFYQREMNRHFGEDHHMPILFFTQLMGLSFGMPAKSLGIGREIISSRKALGNIGIEVPLTEEEEAEKAAAAKPRRRKRDDPALPAPAPRVDEETLR